MKDDIVFIGDIHGELSMLSNLISAIDKVEYCELVFLGDYVNKGSESREVIEFLIELDGREFCTFLSGNHDECFLNALKTGIVSDLLRVGGAPTIRSYVSTPVLNPVGDVLCASIPDSHLEFLEGLSDYYKNGIVIAKHKPWRVKDSSLGFCGHVPRSKVPVCEDGLVYLDTGCGDAEGGILSAVFYPSGKVIQVAKGGDLITRHIEFPTSFR